MWLSIAVTAYFINAGVYVADKFLLSKKIHSSIVYAFYVSVWSFLNIVILAIDPWMPDARGLALDLAAGLLFLATLVFWYKALHQSEATRVVPIVGALVPVFSFLLSFIFLGETLSERQFLAFIILVIGGILISVKHTKFYEMKAIGERVKNIFGSTFGKIKAEYNPTRRLIMNSLVSALFFAAYYVLIKYVYNTQPFIGGFVWSRMGSFLGALLILAVPDWRRKIIKKTRRKRKVKKTALSIFFFFFIRLMAAVAFILLNRAISLGNVALINSLQGIQYVFLFFIVFILSSRYPKVIEEEWGASVLLQKTLGALLVCLGLYMLATNIG
ncbi:EamA family transporter [Candidatus Falkowbacteria bacterium]|nr:EamA family transporter [Candidatus Falkowbacteria bacterium]